MGTIAGSVQPFCEATPILDFGKSLRALRMATLNWMVTNPSTNHYRGCLNWLSPATVLWLLLFQHEHFTLLQMTYRVILRRRMLVNRREPVDGRYTTTRMIGTKEATTGRLYRAVL